MILISWHFTIVSILLISNITRRKNHGQHQMTHILEAFIRPSMGFGLWFSTLIELFIVWKWKETLVKNTVWNGKWNDGQMNNKKIVFLLLLVLLLVTQNFAGVQRKCRNMRANVAVLTSWWTSSAYGQCHDLLWLLSQLVLAIAFYF